MKVNKNNFLKTILAFSVFSLIVSFSFGQNTPPPTPYVPFGPPQAPIDGGLLLLTAVGILYGINKSKKKN